jgi:hypothetical protein
MFLRYHADLDIPFEEAEPSLLQGPKYGSRAC